MSAHPVFPAATRFVILSGPLKLESGVELPQVTVAYRTWGRLNVERDNAVLVCHALTGSADADQWWPGLLGSGRALDPARDFIVCSNVLGSCYGSTGPGSLNAAGQRYGADFPAVTVRDMVRAQARLLDELDVAELALVVGGSLGGMQVLEWAALYPERVQAAAAISVGARQSAWCIGFSEAQRQAIYADARWQGGDYAPADPPAAGLAAARMMALCSYRHWGEFDARFGRQTAADGHFQVQSYLHHQGGKFLRRFDANAYVALTRAMDSHDLGRGRSSHLQALTGIDTPFLVVGSTSDVLYPPAEQAELAQHLPRGELAWLNSSHGHDAFLIDTDQLDAHLQAFRQRQLALSRYQRRRYSCQA